MKSSKKLLCLVALGFVSSSAFSVTIDSTIWDGFTSFFSKLDDVIAEMNTAKDLIAATNTKINEQEAKYDGHNTKRDAVFACIKNKFKTLSRDIEDCLDNKQSIFDQGEIDKKKLIADIESLRKATQLQIDELNTKIAEIQAKIEEYKIALASLSEMSTEAVDAAIAKLTVIKTGYESFKTERTSFISNLDKLVTRLKAFDFETNKDIDEMEAEYCKNENN